ncbi:MAG: hypothetical protein U0R72_18600 [Nakamurella multipartita]
MVEEPFVFAERHAGESKASMAEGLQLLGAARRPALRPDVPVRLRRALGAVLNLLLMAALLAFDVHYLPAAVIATEVTIITNFAMTEGGSSATFGTRVDRCRYGSCSSLPSNRHARRCCACRSWSCWSRSPA